ncbi:H-2 class II histocompatibility antigen, E-S beta chain-like [Saimiri boliviensis]|uniref:H-2 class II histocompatibility antigen, E-S beta chain-like n=1 Tax=Saimiri boliviensis TaxID=27679 RepID=UPI003D7861EE
MPQISVVIPHLILFSGRRVCLGGGSQEEAARAAGRGGSSSSSCSEVSGTGWRQEGPKDLGSEAVFPPGPPAPVRLRKTEDEPRGCAWWELRVGPVRVPRARTAPPAPAPGSPDDSLAVGVFPGGRPRDRIVRVHTGRFLRQFKPERRFFNRTERVRYLDREIYNQEEHVRFDSDVGEFRAVTELGRPIAEHFNSQKDHMEETRATVDTVCRHNRGTGDCVSCKDPAPAAPQPPGLLCEWFPGSIEVRWFWNGQEEKAGVVFTGLIHNGDWTFQMLVMLVMLETVPQSGEVYICRVEHPSVMSPLTVQCRAQSESAQSKLLSGVGGFVLGLLFPGAGLFIHFRNQKGEEPLVADFLHRLFWRRKEKICFAEVSSRYMSGPV